MEQQKFLNKKLPQSYEVQRNFDLHNINKIRLQNFPSIYDEHIYLPHILEDHINDSYQNPLNHSFLISQGDKEILLCPVYTESHRITHMDFPVKFFQSEEFLLDKNLSRIISLELKNIQVKSETKFIPVILTPSLTKAFFYKIIGHDLYYRAQVDLNLSSELLFKNLRKSFKSLVNWGKRNIDIKIISSENINHNSFVEFKDFYEGVSGKKKAQSEWSSIKSQILNGTAFSVNGYIKNKLCSVSLFFVGEKEGYYGLGAYDKKLTEKKVPISQWPMFAGIIHLKKKMKNIVTLGVIYNSCQDKKELDIFHFKLGFCTDVRQETVSLLNFLDGKLN
ncbi:hypothetical protein OAK75_00175 [Bacteriovoracales bacterium]|nr:hypothetical protein [Bacteriovoracales bacterium]